MEEYQHELSNVLGINKFKTEFGYSSTKSDKASWPEIFVEIGKLQERAEASQDLGERPMCDIIK